MPLSKDEFHSIDEAGPSLPDLGRTHPGRGVSLPPRARQTDVRCREIVDTNGPTESMTNLDSEGS
ncbi:uncharacterized protein Hqrw_2064 [Haloquadratum walsbyi C23]|uniref:Uncharacterized protein n=1 Tax=Haloquadratum walsbyi (strain DSM 16854 / JCM 12705 / C23) TaxID=768065 RepID=G0LKL1_HALWC|nr:uncharacterized protein Hqrw_2064 [Haloquadratum walsbyi C23]